MSIQGSRSIKYRKNPSKLIFRKLVHPYCVSPPSLKATEADLVRRPVYVCKQHLKSRNMSFRPQKKIKSLPAKNESVESADPILSVTQLNNSQRPRFKTSAKYVATSVVEDEDALTKKEMILQQPQQPPADTSNRTARPRKQPRIKLPLKEMHTTLDVPSTVKDPVAYHRALLSSTAAFVDTFPPPKDRAQAAVEEALATPIGQPIQHVPARMHRRQATCADSIAAFTDNGDKFCLEKIAEFEVGREVDL